MEPRGWWTVGLTAVAGPLGAVAGAWILTGLSAAADAGSAGLAVGVGGLILGGPLLAVIAFAVCLFTLLRDWGLKVRLGLTIMIGAALLDAIVVVLGLRAISGSSFADTAIVGLGLMSMAVLGAGAHVAITTADR